MQAPDVIHMFNKECFSNVHNVDDVVNGEKIRAHGRRALLTTLEMYVTTMIAASTMEVETESLMIMIWKTRSRWLHAVGCDGSVVLLCSMWFVFYLVYTVDP